jgi:type IV secretory pathway component VirB8
VLAYLSRYTHRVAIANSRLIKADAASVTFKVKNYRVEGPARYTTMTLDTNEFIRRFLIQDTDEAAMAAFVESCRRR